MRFCKKCGWRLLRQGSLGYWFCTNHECHFHYHAQQ